MRERLIALLKSRFRRHGLVLAHESLLIDRLQISPRELRVALKELVAAGEITVISPLPFLALKLTSWSGSRRPAVVEEQRKSNDSHRALDVPVSSGSIAAAAKSSRDGGQGEGGALLEHVLVTLGPEADRDEFRQILEGRSPTIVRQALRRVQSTARIRVSRAALFRALLDRLS